MAKLTIDIPDGDCCGWCYLKSGDISKIAWCSQYHVPVLRDGHQTLKCQQCRDMCEAQAKEVEKG